MYRSQFQVVWAHCRHSHFHSSVRQLLVTLMESMLVRLSGREEHKAGMDTVPRSPLSLWNSAHGGKRSHSSAMLDVTHLGTRSWEKRQVLSRNCFHQPEELYEYLPLVIRV